MTPARFRSALATHGLSRRRAAALLGMSLSQVQRYVTGEHVVPALVSRFLAAWSELTPQQRRRVEEVK